MQFKLNNSQLQVVDHLVETYKDQKSLNKFRSHGSPKAYTNGLPGNNFELLKHVFSSVIGNHQIYQAMILNAFKPWNIHSDYEKGDTNPGNAILIPYKTQNSHTVVFNEHCKTDLNDCVNIPGNTVDEELWNRYLSHIPKNNLLKVTVKEIYAWTYGTGVIWSRLELHCSDNFIKNNIDTKIALVIFTERV